MDRKALLFRVRPRCWEAPRGHSQSNSLMFHGHLLCVRLCRDRDR